MLPALTILLVYQTIGEIAALWLGLPVPGPVIGMVMLFANAPSIRDVLLFPQMKPEA